MYFFGKSGCAKFVVQKHDVGNVKGRLKQLNLPRLSLQVRQAYDVDMPKDKRQKSLDGFCECPQTLIVTTPDGKRLTPGNVGGEWEETVDVKVLSNPNSLSIPKGDEEDEKDEKVEVSGVQTLLLRVNSGLDLTQIG